MAMQRGDAVRQVRKFQVRNAAKCIAGLEPGMPAYQRYRRAFNPIEISLGENLEEEEQLEYRPGEESNGLLLVTGGAGAGKTDGLKRIIGELAWQACPVLTVDVHGDVIAPGQNDVVLTDGMAAQASVNPLAVTRHGMHWYGLKAKIDQILSLIERAGGKLGHKQVACFRTILARAYEVCGIDEAQPWTWDLPAPNFASIAELLSRAIDQGQNLHDPQTLRDCHSKIDSFAGSRVFNHPNVLSVEQMKAWNLRLDCSRLSLKAQQVLAETVLQMIFEEHRAMGPIPVACNGDRDRFRVFVVLDEAKVLTMSKGDVDRSDHIVNVLATEGRKFGIGLVLASQLEEHFGRDTLANAACRLAMRPMDNKEAVRIAKTMEVSKDTLLGLKDVGAGVYRSGAAGQSVLVKLDKAEERAQPEQEARKPI
jgi:hypothetical protein